MRMPLYFFLYDGEKVKTDQKLKSRGPALKHQPTFPWKRKLWKGSNLDKRPQKCYIKEFW